VVGGDECWMGVGPCIGTSGWMQASRSHTASVLEEASRGPYFAWWHLASYWLSHSARVLLGLQIECPLKLPNVFQCCYLSSSHHLSFASLFTSTKQGSFAPPPLQRLRRSYEPSDFPRGHCRLAPLRKLVRQRCPCGFYRESPHLSLRHFRTFRPRWPRRGVIDLSVLLSAIDPFGLHRNQIGSAPRFLMIFEVHRMRFTFVADCATVHGYSPRLLAEPQLPLLPG